jgi:hypothetical protein
MENVVVVQVQKPKRGLGQNLLILGVALMCVGCFLSIIGIPLGIVLAIVLFFMVK